MDYDKIIENLEARIATSEKALQACMIDYQMLVKREKQMRPGIGTKLAYDANGLIVDSFPLTEDDIPMLPASKIRKLKETMDAVASTTRRVDEIQSFINQVYDHDKPVHTGTKVNVDNHGFVTDVSNLLSEDIPMIPISKVESLQETLDSLSPDNSPAPLDDFHTEPNTGTVVTYDYKGRVLSSRNLTSDDLPTPLISRIDNIEHQVDVLSTSIEDLKKILNSKVDRIHTIPGTYTKVTITEDGLVSNATTLESDDIPSISITDIPNLQEHLLSTASNSQLEELRSQLLSIESHINRLENSKPSQDNNPIGMSMEINKLKSTISQLSARIYQLENKN